MQRYNKVLISYEEPECIQYMFLCKHSKSLDELKLYIDKVMKSRKVYEYKIHSIEETNDDDIENIKGWVKNEWCLRWKTKRNNKKDD